MIIIAYLLGLSIIVFLIAIIVCVPLYILGLFGDHMLKQQKEERWTEACRKIFLKRAEDHLKNGTL